MPQILETTLDFQIWLSELDKFCQVSRYSIFELHEYWVNGMTPEGFYLKVYLPF